MEGQRNFYALGRRDISLTKRGRNEPILQPYDLRPSPFLLQVHIKKEIALLQRQC